MKCTGTAYRLIVLDGREEGYAAALPKPVVQMSNTHPPHLEIGARTEPPHLDFDENQHPLDALAHADDAAAQEWLGAHSHDRSDCAHAARWYRKAANQGSAGARYNLGWLCVHRHGVAKDDTQALAPWQQAAQGGFTRAMNGLGLGLGQVQDVDKARHWWTRAAAQGESLAKGVRG